MLIAVTAWLGCWGLSHAESDIDLSGYTLTFHDEFDRASIATVSPKGAAIWYYQPPYGPAGNYSASRWDAAAFRVEQGILIDEAWKAADGHWHSGNISSMDPTEAGFAQKYGYFEARVQMPDSKSGAWPAFWLATQGAIHKKTGRNLEIDIFEWYGVSHDNIPGVVQQAAHLWNVNGPQGHGGLYAPRNKIPDGSQPWAAYHIYGCRVDPAQITWYIDGLKTNQISTPTNYLTSPLYMMIDYALGGGWPLSGMIDHSALRVDWVRVYSLPK